MRIAVTAETGDGLESAIAGHFGHAPFFVFVNVEDGRISTAENVASPFGGGHAPGEVPSFIKERNAEVILSGGMGGRAVSFFKDLGIDVATGASGNVRSAVEQYLKGELSGVAPCSESVEHGQ